jgi:hypothetical membrane protein
MEMNRPVLIGFIGPLIGLLSILVSILVSPAFDWSTNALSDLGSWVRTDLGAFQLISAISFNGGLIIAGLSTAYSAFTLFNAFQHRASAFAMTIFTQTGVLLFLVGIFAEDFIIPHALAAMGFFLTIPLAMGVMGASLVFKSELRVVGVLTLLGGIVAFLAMFTPWAGIAPRELAEALVAILWLWSLNIMKLRGNLDTLREKG